MGVSISEGRDSYIRQLYSMGCSFISFDKRESGNKYALATMTRPNAGARETYRRHIALENI